MSEKCMFIIFPCLLLACSDNNLMTIPDHILSLDHLVVIDAENGPSHKLKLLSDGVRFGNDPDHPSTLGRIGVDHSGRLFATDNLNQIHLFDADGVHLTHFGRSGRGPGEFISAPYLSIQSGYLYAFDRALYRISQISIDSMSLVQTLQLDFRELEGEAYRLSQFDMISDTLFLVTFEQLITRPPRPGQKVQPNRVSYAVDRDNVLQKLLELPGSSYLAGNAGNSIRLATNFPFHGRPLLAVSGTGEIHSARSDDFLIKVYSANGEYDRSYFAPFIRVMLSRDEAIRTQEDEVRRRILQQYGTPDTWPALNDLLIDDENRLWVSTIVEDFEVYRWWVLEENGELIARLDWPRAEPIEVVRNGFVYTRETDPETGIQQIVRYRIELEER